MYKKRKIQNKVGNIINSANMYEKFISVYDQEYYVDKSNIINEFNKLIGKDSRKYVCITKPRRFGKTSIAAMLVSYYSKGIDCKEIFDQLNVAKGKSSDKKENEWERKQYAEFQNKFHTLYFDFSYDVKRHNNLDDYLASINAKLKEDVEELFPDSKVLKKYKDTIYENLKYLCNETGEQFILIIDEWDYIITSSKFSHDDKDKYISFLKDLIKDQGYIAFTYMTGITAISKELSHSTLNCFDEFSMLNDKEYFQYFDFTENEVRALCENNKNITYEELENWYNGYKGPNGEKIFNPWSIVQALIDNEICNYWTETGRFDELKLIIDLNINGVRKEIFQLTKEEEISITLNKYGAEDIQKEVEEEMSADEKKKELYSKMVTFGFLTYYDGKISIPNKEVMEKFKTFLSQKPEMKYYGDLIENSGKMIKATLRKDTKEMCDILINSHMEKIMPRNKMDHGGLKHIMEFVYFNIRKDYDVKKESKEGLGEADLIFIPKDKNKTLIIIELKVNSTAENVVKRKHDKMYYRKFKKEHKGNILLVGIYFLKKGNSKKYMCKIEEYKIEKNNKMKLISVSESDSEARKLNESNANSLNKRKKSSNLRRSKRIKSIIEKKKKGK